MAKECQNEITITWYFAVLPITIAIELLYWNPSYPYGRISAANL